MQSGNCYPCRESLATTNDAMVGTWQNVLAETMHVCVCVCGYINRNKQGKKIKKIKKFILIIIIIIIVIILKI